MSKMSKKQQVAFQTKTRTTKNPDEKLWEL